MGNCCSSCRPRKEPGPKSGKNRRPLRTRTPGGQTHNHIPLEDLSPIINVAESVNDGRRSAQSSTALPSTRQYYMKTGKKTVQLLQAAAQLVSVPFVKDALEVVLKLIEVCEDVTFLQEQLDDLKDRLGSLGLIIYDLVESRGGLEATLEPGIAKLGNDLKGITTNLQHIRDQSKWALGFQVNLNKESIEDCVKRITFALEEFHLSNAIDTKKDLHRILRNLEGVFRPQLNIVGEDVEEIKHDIKEMEHDVKKVREDVEILIKNARSHDAATFSSSGMPARLAKFRGRHRMVTTIGDCLCSNDPTKTRVAVLAPGGMGKTSLAVEVMESKIIKRKFDFEHRFWVSCKGAKSFAIFVQVLASSLRVKTDLGDLRRDIQTELAVSKAPRLIVLDNFETPWGTPSEQNDVETVLCDLARLPHVAILITMRSNIPPSNNIAWHVEALQPVDPEASRQIYTDIDPSAVGHTALDELLATLGHMPYAIKLIATLGKESESRPDILLYTWKKKGTAILGDKNEMERSISLSVESNLMCLHPEARSLLITLSMLPAGATSDHLDWWAPDLEDQKLSAIAVLNRTALISKAADHVNSTWFVYPVVQRYMEHTHQISKQDRVNLQQAAYKFIMDHKSSPGDNTFRDDLKALASEDINLQSILMFAAAHRMAGIYDRSDFSADSKLLDSLLTFGFYQLWSKPVLDITQLTVDVACHLGSKHHLAEGLNCLGHICRHFADYDGAIVALGEARTLFKRLSNPLRSAQTTYLLMHSYMPLDRESTQLERDTLEADAHAELEALGATGDPQLRAILMITIGFNQRYNRQFNDSLQCFTHAQTTFRPLGHSFEAAQCLHLVGRSHLSMGDYLKAMKSAQLLMKEYEYLGLDPPRKIAWQMEGYCLLKLKEYDKALHIFQGCLPESRRLGSVLGIAQDLEFIAQVFEQKGDVALVKLGYASALEQYNIIMNTPMGRDGKKRCEHNLSALTNYDINDVDANKDSRSLMPPMQHFKFA